MNGRPADGLPATVPPMIVPSHGLTRYMRARLEVDAGELRWETPRAVLGVVPVGMRHISAPVGDVRSLRVHRVIRPVDLVAGLAIAATPIVLGFWWLVVPAIIVGAWVVLVSLGPRLDASIRGGRTLRADVCFAHELDAELYVHAVKDLAAATGSPESGGT